MLLGVMGAPLAPVHISPGEPLPHLSIKDTLIIGSKFLLSTKLSVEGPLRMKEECVEGVLETPTVSKYAIPEQLKGALGHATGSMQQLPAPIKDVISNRVKLPLGGTFQRLFIISYLDDEIMFDDVLSQPEPTEDLRKPVDLTLGDDYPIESIHKMAQLAKACTQENPQLRPSMRSIVVALMTLSS